MINPVPETEPMISAQGTIAVTPESSSALLTLPAPAQLPASLEHIQIASTEDLTEAGLTTDTVMAQAMKNELILPKPRKGKGQAPIDTASLQCSNRSNKYDGFRVNLHNESHSTKSKVKPRVLPSAFPSANAADDQDATIQSTEMPPPTPIPTMQNIGTHLCAIPAGELSEEILTEGDDGLASSSS